MAPLVGGKVGSTRHTQEREAERERERERDVKNEGRNGVMVRST